MGGVGSVGEYQQAALEGEKMRAALLPAALGNVGRGVEGGSVGSKGECGE